MTRYQIDKLLAYDDDEKDDRNRRNNNNNDKVNKDDHNAKVYDSINTDLSYSNQILRYL